jgi:hypothetical protein
MRTGEEMPTEAIFSIVIAAGYGFAEWQAKTVSRSTLSQRTKHKTKLSADLQVMTDFTLRRNLFMITLGSCRADEHGRTLYREQHSTFLLSPFYDNSRYHVAPRSAFLPLTAIPRWRPNTSPLPTTSCTHNRTAKNAQNRRTIRRNRRRISNSSLDCYPRARNGCAT